MSEEKKLEEEHKGVTIFGTAIPGMNLYQVLVTAETPVSPQLIVTALVGTAKKVCEMNGGNFLRELPDILRRIDRLDEQDRKLKNG